MKFSETNVQEAFDYLTFKMCDYCVLTVCERILSYVLTILYESLPLTKAT